MGTEAENLIKFAENPSPSSKNGVKMCFLCIVQMLYYHHHYHYYYL